MLGLLMVCLRPLLAQPANDHFTNAIPLTSLAGAYTGTNHFAAGDPGEPSHGVSGGGKSVWFQWMAPSTTWMRFDVVNARFVGSQFVFEFLTASGQTF